MKRYAFIWFIVGNALSTEHDSCRNSMASFAILLSCKHLRHTSHSLRVQNGSMGSTKEISLQCLVQHFVWQPLRYVTAHIIGLLLMHSQVERILRLWSSGNLTIEMVREAKNAKRAIKLPPVINPATGKESARYSAFSEGSWGKPTRAFIKSARKMDDEAIERIIDGAKEYARVSLSRSKDEETDDADSEDNRANLVEGAEYFSDDMEM
jgi:hypothetical protein